MKQEKYSPSEIARFQSKFERSGPIPSHVPEIGECWEWKCGKSPAGYGCFYFSGQNRPAHRVAFEIENHTIPEGMFACHKCDNPSCVNPRHIFIGTQKDNIDDMRAKGRSNYMGPKNPCRGDNHPSKFRPKEAFSHLKAYRDLHPEMWRGENAKPAKLKEEDVRDIRRRYDGGEVQTALAEAFGVSQTVIHNVIRFKSWKHVA
jgi:hypothetical protein